MGHSPTQRFLLSPSIFKGIGLKTRGGVVPLFQKLSAPGVHINEKKGSFSDTVFSNDCLADSSLAVQLPSKHSQVLQALTSIPQLCLQQRQRLRSLKAAGPARL